MCVCERERERERQRERETDRQTDRQTGRRADRGTDREYSPVCLFHPNLDICENEVQIE